MKPDGMSWHEYLRDYSQICWRTAQDERRYFEISRLLQPLYRLWFGPVLDSTGPKRIFKVRTPMPVRLKGHPPWTFKAQCLTTGRVSTPIPYERYIEFGVFTEYATTGGPFPEGPQDIEDRIRPKLDALLAQLDQVRPAGARPTMGCALSGIPVL
jgi:hypothetical protein